MSFRWIFVDSFDTTYILGHQEENSMLLCVLDILFLVLQISTLYPALCPEDHLYGRHSSGSMSFGFLSFLANGKPWWRPKEEGGLRSGFLPYWFSPTASCVLCSKEPLSFWALAPSPSAYNLVINIFRNKSSSDHPECAICWLLGSWLTMDKGLPKESGLIMIWYGTVQYGQYSE